MPAERNAFKLGLTMILFVVLFVAVLYFLAPTGGGDMSLKVRFPHNEFTTILKPGGEVICGGYSVGAIRGLDLVEMFDTHGGGNLLYSVVTISVDSSIGLKKDCKIVPEGMLLGDGGKLVVLDRGMAEPVKEGDTIDGQTTSDIAALTRTLAAQLDPKDPASLLAMIKSQLDATDAKSLLGKIHRSLDDVNTVTASISHEFDPREKAALIAKLHGIMDRINDATRLLRDQMDQEVDQAMAAKLHQMLDTLQGGLQNVVDMFDENREPITQTIAHVRNTSQILEEQIAAKIAKEFDVSEAASLLAKVHVSIDRLGDSLTDINAITASSKEVLLLNKEQISGMLANFKQTSDHLKAASKEIRRSPWRLFYQPSIEEAEQANVFDAARSFSEAATRLDDVIVRLQALDEATGGEELARDEQLANIRDQLQQTFSHFTQAETALWEQLKIK